MSDIIHRKPNAQFHEVNSFRVSSPFEFRDLYSVRILEIECENERFAFLFRRRTKDRGLVSITFARRPCSPNETTRYLGYSR